MVRATKGSLEAEIATAVVRFHREQQGRGPADVRAHLVGDMLLVRSTGVLTPVEQHLAASEEGCRLIQHSRNELRSINHREIEETVAGIVGCAVLRSYADIDVEAAEQIEVYILGADVEKRLLRLELDRLGGLAQREPGGHRAKPCQ